MTIEELKDEFAEYLADSEEYYSPKEPLTDRKFLQIWLDCAEPREKKIQNLKEENKQLKSLIEKMKNCANCDYWFDMDSTCELHKKEIWDFMIDCGCKDWKCAYKEVEE